MHQVVGVGWLVSIKAVTRLHAAGQVHTMSEAASCGPHVRLTDWPDTAAANAGTATDVRSIAPHCRGAWRADRSSSN